MLDLRRAYPPVSSGLAVLGASGVAALRDRGLAAAGVRGFAALAVLVLTTSIPGCAPSTAPQAPDAAATAAEPLEEPASTLAEPEPAGSSPSSAEPSALEPSAAEPAATEPAAPRQRDTRGKEEIQQVMASNRDAVRACYDAALAKHPGIAGDLVVSFTIDPRGDVKQAEVNGSESDLHIPELDTCAVDAVRSIKFPPSSRGLESKVNYPFNFNPPRSAPPPAKR